MTIESKVPPTDVMDLYKAPFEYQHGYIFDADSLMVMDTRVPSELRVRGWGRIQYYKNAEAIQDAIGHHIAKALSEYWEKNKGR